MIKQKTQKYLRDRFSDLAKKAVDLKTKIDTAKTNFKKEYYSKKLNKINKEALDVLILINSSQQVVQQSTASDKSLPISQILEDAKDVIQD